MSSNRDIRIATVTLVGAGEMCQSKFFPVEKNDKETHDDYERRSWRRRIHRNQEGYVTIPATAVLFALASAARRMSEKIAGRGASTWTKRFETGLMLPRNPVTNVKADTVEGRWLMLNADGKRGSGRRVPRCIPVIDNWSSTFEIYVLDGLIDEDRLSRYLTEAGQFVGFGQNRIENLGQHGRFLVDKIEWRQQ